MSINFLTASRIIEDDGKVYYAYLLLNTSIIRDVWLYNQSDAPFTMEWKKEEMPFLNPREYIKEWISICPISKSEEVKIEWLFSDNH